MNASCPFDLLRLRDETFVAEIDFHWELESTNTRALLRAEEASTNTPLLVLAERQTVGRGRGTNRWWSAPGAVTCSLVVRLDDLPGDRIPQLALTTGLAICQAIEQFAPQADVAIKWPNDVYLDERKLAGILIELPSCQPPRAVLGFGINVNNSFTSAEPALARNAISLVDALEVELDRTELLIASLQQFERRLNELRRKPGELVDQWRAYHLLQNRHVEIDTYGGRLRGICLGIDDQGAMLLQTDSGQRRCLGGVVAQFER